MNKNTKMKIAVEIKLNKTEAAISNEIPVVLRPKGVQFLDWRLLQFMYDRFFRYDRPCFLSAFKLAKILSPGKGSAASIRNSRCRLKKAGLIEIQNAKSDRSWKTVSYCFISEKGRALMQKFFEIKQQEKNNSSKFAQKPDLNERYAPEEPKPDKVYTPFDYRVSRRFSKQIQKSYPMKNPAKWSEDWAVVIRKLREVDGFTEKEITDTIQYILDDNKPRTQGGFCLAKVMRSCLQFRKKWKNDMTKFCTAYEDMKAKRLANPDINDEETLPFALRKYPDGTDRRILTPPRDITSELQTPKNIAETYERLMSLPHPDWKMNSEKFLKWEQYCFDLSLFFEELIEDRGWEDRITDHFFLILKKDNEKLKLYTLDILKEKVKIFFEDRVPKFCFCDIGRYNQWGKIVRNGKIVWRAWFNYDETYLQRFYDFAMDQAKGDPFARQTELIPDEEVEADCYNRFYKKGEFYNNPDWKLVRKSCFDNEESD